jgi:aminopeptidase N
MTNVEPQMRYRADFQAPDFLVSRVFLDFDLDPQSTTINSQVYFKRNPECTRADSNLILDGQDLELVGLTLDGRDLSADHYHQDERTLVIPDVPPEFVLAVETRVSPAGNMTFMGLNQSRDGALYTQCESEAFRKLTYFPDRPDIMAPFVVTLRADKERFPVLISNGNPAGHGELADGRHWAKWEDPVPKPCYLFALLAGDFAAIRDTYTTRSGRDISLSIFAREEFLEKVAPSMALIKRAMAWDEEVFGLEYDLDVFNVGVVEGMLGCMENKGLNLYDLAWLTTDPKTTIDDDYEYRMKTIAHEYFHNWTGDKIACRNWFHLTFKEGFSRFRDQLYIAEQTDAASVRINMVRHICTNQFTEDSSPNAHACLIDAYIDPRNLYSHTVVDKGQEITRMLCTVLGWQKFKAGCDLFFRRWAGKAVAIDDLLSAMQEASGVNLAQFKRWYSAAGTCEITASGDYDSAAHAYTLTLSQSLRYQGTTEPSAPLHIPIALGLLGRETGRQLPLQLDGESAPSAGCTRLIELRKLEETYRFINVTELPVVSLLRDFSAPARLSTQQSDQELAILVAHDPDPVARWLAAEEYASRTILGLVENFRAKQELGINEKFDLAYAQALYDSELNERLMVDLLTLPSEKALSEKMSVIDVDGIHEARGVVAHDLALKHKDRLITLYEENAKVSESARDANSIGRRRLKNLCLQYLMALGEETIDEMCLAQLKDSENITDQVRALEILCGSDSRHRADAIEIYYDRWHSDSQVLDKWFRAQAGASRRGVSQDLDRLMGRRDFDLSMFNRLFNVCEAYFYLNFYGVHEPGGAGYELVVKQLLRIDKHVPVMSAWSLERSDIIRWRRFDKSRGVQMQNALQEILNAPGISDGLYEIASKALN